MGEEVAELHLYIARALQRLATTAPQQRHQQQQLKRKKAAVVGSTDDREDESNKERKRRATRTGGGGGGKAKEAFGDDLEYEEEASEDDEDEDEDETTKDTKGEGDDDEEDGELIFEALDRFEGEWRREATRFERRLCELRASCLRWKVQQEINVQKMRLQLRRGEANGGDDETTDRHSRPTGGSVVDRLVEALIELQAEGRHAAHHKKRAQAETQARSTLALADAENADSESYTSELLSSSSPFSRSLDLDRDHHKDPEMANGSEPASTPTTPPPERKAVSFITSSAASSGSSGAPQEVAAKEEGEEGEQAVSSKQRRRVMSVDGLPSHKRDRKKKKKGHKSGKKKGSFLASGDEERHELPLKEEKKHGFDALHVEVPSPAPRSPRKSKSLSPKPERKEKEKEKEKEKSTRNPEILDEEALSRHDSSNTTWYNTDTDEEMSDSSEFEDEDEDSWESDEVEMALQRDALSPPEQDLRGIVGLVQGKGVKPVLCEVGGHNLNCCNLLLQGMSKLEEPIIEKKGRAQDLVTESGNVPAAFNILLCPQQNPADVLELAADSDSDMQRWLAFFRSLYTNHGGASLIQGFLWLHVSSRKMRLSPGSWTGLTNISNLTELAVETKWQWQRYYCICDSSRFEWFALSYVKVVPLHSVIQVQTSVIEPTRTIKFTSRRNTKSAFIGWGEEVEKVLDLRYYRYKISLIKANSKESFAFLTSSTADMHAWSRAIVSHQREPETRRSGGGSSFSPSLIEEKSPRPERNAGETIVRTKYREFRHRRNVKVMKDDEDTEVLKIRSSCRQFRKKAEQNMAAAQWRKQRSKSAGNLRGTVNAPASPRIGSRDDFHPLPSGHTSPRSPRIRESPSGGATAAVTANKKTFVLSLDGGGSRCIMQTVILQRLVQVFPDLLSKFDLFAGVSGGSINAAMLATGIKPELMAEIQKFMAPAVFGKGKRQATLELKGLSLRRAKYSADPLLILGEELFQGQSLAKCSSRLLIVSFVLDNEKDGQGRMWEPRVYHNVPMKKTDEAEQLPFAMKKRDLEDTPLWDHCLASSAAPTYFKTHRKHVDGGVVSNTASSGTQSHPHSLNAAVVLWLPAIAALMSDGAEQPVKASDLYILNIGTGRIMQYLEGEDDDHDWGIIQWGPKLPGLLFAAHDSFGHQLSSSILGNRYHRLDPFLERPLGMDDASSLPALIHLAQTINLDDTIAWIRHHMYAEAKPSGGIGINSGSGHGTRPVTGISGTKPARRLFPQSSATIPAGPSASPGLRTSQTWDNAWFNAHSPGSP